MKTFTFPPKTGGIARNIALVKKENDKTETPLGGMTDSQPVPYEGGGEAKVMYQLGFSIPGPPNSYTMARVDVGVSLPCGSSAEEVQAAYWRAKTLVEAQLDTDLVEAKEALAQL